MRHWLGLGFFAFQGLAFIWAKFEPTRYFCWAPYDQHCRYAVDVSLRGRALSPAEIEARYQIAPTGYNPRSYTEITRTIEQYETTYGAPENARVRVRYSVNGRDRPDWVFPEE